MWLVGLWAWLLGVCGAAEVLPRELVRTETWQELWPDARGQPVPRAVTGEIWTAALQAVIDTQKTLHLPAREEPYYLDGPLILRSGDRLTADTKAEIRLKPGTNTCMVRNESIHDCSQAPVPAALVPDTGITIEGGIWSTLANGVKGANGNLRGASARQNPAFGTHGVILLQNIRQVRVRNVTIRAGKAFGVHLANVSNFEVDGVTLERHERDGVHVNGPASHGVIHNVRGDSHDDTVALNAWEWQNYAPSYGPIHHVTVESVRGSPPEKRSADSIRLLSGVKRFADGTTLDCPIHDIELRDLADLRELKFYDQPNLELGRDRDFSVEIGKLSNIRLRRLSYSRQGFIDIAAHVDGFIIEDVDVNYTPAARTPLVRIGPMSQTYRHGPDPKHWVELFSPDRDITLRGFFLRNVRLHGERVTDEEAASQFLRIRDQKLNPDYPKTTPRGGTGKVLLQQ